MQKTLAGRIFFETQAVIYAVVTLVLIVATVAIAGMTVTRFFYWLSLKMPEIMKIVGAIY